MSVKARFLTNSFSNAAGWAWLTVLNIAAIPYIVRKLGYDGYGILSLVSLVLGYFAFLDFGLGSAVIKYISYYHALDDIRRTNRIVNSTLFLFLIIGLAGACLIIIFTRFFALKIFNIPAPLHSTALSCFYLSAIGFSLNLVLGVISRIPEALQRFDLSNKVNTAVGTLVTLSNVLILFLGYGLTQVVVMNIIGSAAGIFLFYTVSKRILPRVSLDMKFSLRDFREVLHFGAYTVFTNFSALITNSINQVVVGSVVGMSGLAVFNIPFRIVSRFQTFIFRLAFIFFPLSSEFHAHSDMKRLRSSYLKLSRYVFLLSSCVFIPLLAYPGEILLYWMGGDFAQKGAAAMFLISLGFYLITFTMVAGLTALGVGKPGYNAIFSTCTAVLNLALVYPLTKIRGITGAGAALLLSVLHFPVDICVINKKILGIGGLEYFRYVFGRNLLIMAIVYSFYYCMLRKFITGACSFALVMAVSYGFLALIVYFQGVCKEDRRYFLDTLKGLRTHA